MILLLAIDPGGSTGYSFWRYDALTPATRMDYGTITGGLRGFIRWWQDTAGGDPDEIVAEDFILDGRAIVRPDTTPLEILGMLEYISATEGIPLIRQRNTMKAGANDAFLKRAGLWIPGKGHDRDSERHALTYLKARKHMPTLKRYWPPRGESAA